MEKNTVYFALMFLITIMILALRAYPVAIGGVTDTLSMVAFTAMNKTVQNNYVLPLNITNLTSSPPYAFRFTEAPFQIYIVTIPYYFLHHFLTILETAYFVKSGFIILSIAVIILFCKRITGSYKSSVFALALFAVYPTANFMQQLPLWTGDFFLPILLLASIIMLIYAKDSYKQKAKMLIFGSLSIVLLMAAYLSWRGGIFAVVSYAFVVLFLGANAMLKDTRKAFIITIIFVIIAYATQHLTYNGLPTMLLILSQQNLMSGNFVLFPNVLLRMGIELLGFALAGGLMLFGGIEFLARKDKEVFGVIILLIIIATPITLDLNIRFASLMFIEIAIVGGVVLSLIRSPLLITFFIILIIVSGLITTWEISANTPVFYYSAPYRNAMYWISSNTPSNSLFLTDYLDSSSVQYLGNRSVYGAFWWNPSVITSFADWIYTSPCNETYLMNTKADYLIINRFWVNNNSADGYEDIAAQYNWTTPPSNATLFALENGTLTSCGNLRLSIIYENGPTKIYKITG